MCDNYSDGRVGWGLTLMIGGTPYRHQGMMGRKEQKTGKGRRRSRGGEERWGQRRATRFEDEDKTESSTFRYFSSTMGVFFPVLPLYCHRVYSFRRWKDWVRAPPPEVCGEWVV